MPSVKRKPKSSTSREPRLASRKPARFGARLTDNQKLLFERAAALTGRSLTDFVIGAAQEVADRTIRDHEVMVLSARDAKALVAALLNPPEPGPRLRAAAEEYKRTMSR